MWTVEGPPGVSNSGSAEELWQSLAASWLRGGSGSLDIGGNGNGNGGSRGQNGNGGNGDGNGGGRCVACPERGQCGSWFELAW